MITWTYEEGKKVNSVNEKRQKSHVLNGLKGFLDLGQLIT